MEVQLRRVPSMRVAFTRHEGPLDRVGGAFDRIRHWVRAHGEPAERVIGVFHETRLVLDDEGNPDGAPYGVAEAWVEFDKQLGDQPDPPLGVGDHPVRIKDVPELEVASVHYRGHPLDIARFQDAFRSFLYDKGFQLAPETRNVFREFDEEDYTNWEAEVQIEVQKRPAPPTATEAPSQGAE